MRSPVGTNGELLLLPPVLKNFIGTNCSAAGSGAYSWLFRIGALMLGIMVMITAAVAGPAGPESSVVRPPVPQQPSKPIVVEGNRRVCHETQSTGSLFTKRVCKTVDQWQQDIAASQAFAAQRAREMTTYQQMQIHIQKDKDN